MLLLSEIASAQFVHLALEDIHLWLVLLLFGWHEVDSCIMHGTIERFDKIVSTRRVLTKRLDPANISSPVKRVRSVMT